MTVFETSIVAVEGDLITLSGWVNETEGGYNKRNRTGVTSDSLEKSRVLTFVIRGLLLNLPRVNDIILRVRGVGRVLREIRTSESQSGGQE